MTDRVSRYDDDPVEVGLDPAGVGDGVGIGEAFDRPHPRDLRWGAAVVTAGGGDSWSRTLAAGPAVDVETT